MRPVATVLPVAPPAPEDSEVATETPSAWQPESSAAPQHPSPLAPDRESERAAEILTISDLTFTYAEREAPALANLDLEVRVGESLLVLGPSGSGKSTLTLCLDGLIPHLVEGESLGRVTVAGLVTADHPVHVLATHVGLVFQDPESQFCTLTVEDEVAFGLENLCVEPAEIERRVDQALADVGLEGFRCRDLSQLSGGEKQRVALASVLAMGPKVLVLDEPSANLDPAAASGLFGRLRDVAAARELTLVVIEHRLDDLAEWVDGVLVLTAEGRVAARGRPADVLYGDGALTAHGVWEPAVVPLVRALRAAGWHVPGRPLGVRAARDALERTPGLVARLRSGAGAGSAAAPGEAHAAVRVAPAAVAPGSPGDGASTTPHGPAQGLLSVRNLTYHYPGQEAGARAALQSVSLDVRPAGFLALVGANGAGKTTLASLLSGVLAPPAGAVFLEGRDLNDLPEDRLTAAVGYVFQNPEHQFVADTVYDEVAFSLIQQRRRGRLTAVQEREVGGWLERFGLASYADRNPFTLSQGEKRRLSVAAMLVRGQRVIILDEPAFGLDMAQTAALLATLEGLRAEGRTVVMVTHDMSLVAEHAQDVVVLGGGRVLFAGPPHRLFAEPDVLAEAHLEPPSLGRLALECGAPGLLTLNEFVAAAGRA
jgi:energy-coupling factor transport system ATP-binding protein